MLLILRFILTFFFIALIFEIGRYFFVRREDKEVKSFFKRFGLTMIVAGIASVLLMR